MCGIAGSIGELDNQKFITNQMVNQLRHRGPDSSGYYHEKNFSLGHCRLAIIDKSTNSTQPVTSAEFVLSFNGEIYNWRDLRKEFRFDPNRICSDTLLLFELLKILPVIEVVRRIRGIYCFVFFDIKKSQGVMVRDKFGTKPLYTMTLGRNIFFASEIKAFMSIPGWRARINDSGLQNYLTFQNNFGTTTLYDGVELLPSNSITTFDLSNSPMLKTQKVPESPTQPVLNDSAETILELDHLLQQAVLRNLEADVEVGGFLSGGIDSSLIASLASAQNRHYRTFTIGFDVTSVSQDETKFDETALAQSIANSIKSENLHHRIGPNDLEHGLDKVSWAIEDPRVGQSYPNLFAAELASKHVRVCLSGTGGDEIFAGYPWRYQPVLTAESIADQHKTLFAMWHRLGTSAEISSLLNIPELEHLSHATNSFYNNSAINRDYPISLGDLLKFEQTTFLQGLLLVEDKISMANSLEVRVPFLDEDLVDFASRLPDSLRFSPQLSDYSVLSESDNLIQKEILKQSGKIALRTVAKKTIPFVSNLSKQGFSAPDSSWFRKEAKSLVYSRLADRNNILWEFLNFEVAEKIISSHMLGVSNRRLLIWSLLTLESTIRQFEFTA